MPVRSHPLRFKNDPIKNGSQPNHNCSGVTDTYKKMNCLFDHLKKITDKNSEEYKTTLRQYKDTLRQYEDLYYRLEKCDNTQNVESYIDCLNEQLDKIQKNNPYNFKKSIRYNELLKKLEEQYEKQQQKNAEMFKKQQDKQNQKTEGYGLESCDEFESISDKIACIERNMDKIKYDAYGKQRDHYLTDPEYASLSSELQEAQEAQEAEDKTRQSENSSLNPDDLRKLAETRGWGKYGGKKRRKSSKLKKSKRATRKR